MNLLPPKSNKNPKKKRKMAKDCGTISPSNLKVGEVHRRVREVAKILGHLRRSWNTYPAFSCLLMMAPGR